MAKVSGMVGTAIIGLAGTEGTELRSSWLGRPMEGPAAGSQPGLVFGGLAAEPAVRRRWGCAAEGLGRLEAAAVRPSKELNNSR
eukprot:14688290-Heterocapsa_arctica.AAC.1